jgi:hypothetical protein
MHALVPHPDMPARRVAAVNADLTMAGPGELRLQYSLASAEQLVVPDARAPERADGLWKTTCFELFLRPADSKAYFEFNFSPSLQWAAYAFGGYRSGMRALPARDPDIWLSRSGDWFFLTVEALLELPPAPLKIGLSAVIEEAGGILSYWALNHPPGPPDFHHPDCFALELPAAPAA